MFHAYTPLFHEMLLWRAQLVYSKLGLKMPPLPDPLEQLAQFKWCKGTPRLVPHRSQNGSVALASFPGSGNTWCRYLLQQVTGKRGAATIASVLVCIVTCCTY